MSWTARALLGFVLSALTALLVLGHGPYAGRELLHITVSHGVNRGDLLAGVLWSVGMLALVPWRRRGPSWPRRAVPGLDVVDGVDGVDPDGPQAASSASTAADQSRFAARQPSSSTPSRQ